MAKSPYLTAPLKTDKMPPGIPYIVGNEAAERFSYYGMNSILVIFMTKYLMDAQGRPDPMSDKDAEGWYHTFVSCAYFLPLFGALLSDAILGKYRTILILSIVYHFLAWLIGVLEPWLILRWIGLPVSLAEAAAIEAFSTGIRFAAFLVPGYLGAPAGLSFTLIRRVREAAWTALGFLLLAPLKAHAPPPAGHPPRVE